MRERPIPARRSAAGLPEMGCPMPSHKFKIGETVILRPAVSRNVPGGIYEVTKQLPHNGHDFDYRIKSVKESHERVVQESELTKP
jgi:hypothetical protein